MSDIRLSSLSRKEITDPLVTEFVDDAVELMKLELIQAFSAKSNPTTSSFLPGTIQVGVQRSVEYDSVAKVGTEKWYEKLASAKRTTVLRTAARVAPQDARLRRQLRNQQIDLMAVKPVFQQFDLANHFSPRNVEGAFDRIRDRLNDFVFPAGGGSGAAVVNKDLRFRINRTKCIDETDPEFLGKDRIAMGGTTVDDKERVAKIKQFIVGEFDDGEQVVYGPPKVLKEFNLAGGTYPKVFTVFLAIAEKDAGGFGDFLTELYEAVKAEVVLIISTLGAAAGAAIGIAVGGSVGTVIGGPIGTAIGIISGLILGALVAWLAGLAQDDLFEPQLTFVELPSADATFTGGALTSPIFNFTFADFGGQYRISYSWQLG